MTTIETRTARATGLLARFASFVAERHPFALRPAVAALDILTGSQDVDETDAWAVDALREPLRRVLLQTLSDFLAPDAAAAQKLQGGVPETTPGISVNQRLHQAVTDVVDACDGFLRREAIAASLTDEEKLEMLGGMVLTRAFACSLPVVASDIPGYREVVTPQTGLLVAPGDATALTEAVVQLLEDEQQRAALGAAARRVAEERYSWDGIAQRLLQVYGLVVDRQEDVPVALEAACA